MKRKFSIRYKAHSAGPKPKGKQGSPDPILTGEHRATGSANEPVLADENWLREMRSYIRTISRQVDELELFFRAMKVLESKQAVRCWFNSVAPALGARPVDLCQTARGRRAVLRELRRIGNGEHS